MALALPSFHPQSMLTFSALRICHSIAFATALAAAMEAQAPESALVERALAAVDADRTSGGHLAVLSADHCPVCHQAMRRILLEQRPAGIDSAPRLEALVCLPDELFLLQSSNLGLPLPSTNKAAGPFALPKSAAEVRRKYLPWGSIPGPELPVLDRPSRAPGFVIWEDSKAGIGSDPDGTLLAWTSAGVVYRERSEMGITASALESNALLMAYARSQQGLRIVSLADGSDTRVNQATGNVTAIAIHPKGSMVAWSTDQTNGVRVQAVERDGNRPRVLASLPVELAGAQLKFATDGTYLLAYSYSGGLARIDLEPPRVRWHVQLSKGLTDALASADAKRIAACLATGDKLWLLDAEKGEIQRTVSLPPSATRGGTYTRCMAWSSDQALGWLCSDGRIAMLASPTAEPRVALGRPYHRIRFAEDGRLFTDFEGRSLHWPERAFLSLR